ncbi:hypothetical protein JTB14_011117 [Gonioctena quinquepunctata]|nr:hypothetical protein JTB14_011117 [Gonioctena quinquepunctata]
MDAEVMTSVLDIKLFRYRWIVLLLFCIFNVVNFMQLLQFTIITNVISKYYQVETSAVDMTALIFFVTYILLFLPISYLIERFNLRITAIVTATVTLAGIIMKVFCQVYIMSIPSKVASLWFGSGEVSTACAIAILGTQLGAAIGTVIPPFVVKEDENIEDIGNGIRNMMIFNASLAAAAFILVLLFFRARPRLPASPSQKQLMETTEKSPSFLQNFKTLIKNKDYLCVLLIFGVVNGIWNSFGILVNTIYLEYFPGSETDVGLIALLAIIIGGCIGSLVFGFILDKTHEFKKTSFAVLFCSTVTFAIVVVSIEVKIKILTYFTIPLFGFFAASALVISFEYALEVTYPVPESVSCSILNAIIFLFAIIFTLVIETLFEAIGFFWTFIAITVLYAVSTCGVFLISSNLRRREANLAGEEMT